MRLIKLLICITILQHTFCYAQKSLNINLKFQKTPSWCWAACGEMTTSFFGSAIDQPTLSVIHDSFSTCNSKLRLSQLSTYSPWIYCSCSNCTNSTSSCDKKKRFRSSIDIEYSSIGLIRNTKFENLFEAIGYKSRQIDSNNIKLDTIINQINKNKPVILVESSTDRNGNLINLKSSHLVLAKGYQNTNTTPSIKLIEILDPSQCNLGASYCVNINNWTTISGRRRKIFTALVDISPKTFSGNLGITISLDCNKNRLDTADSHVVYLKVYDGEQIPVFLNSKKYFVNLENESVVFSKNNFISEYLLLNGKKELFKIGMGNINYSDLQVNFNNKLIHPFEEFFIVEVPNISERYIHFKINNKRYLISECEFQKQNIPKIGKNFEIPKVIKCIKNQFLEL